MFLGAARRANLTAGRAKGASTAVFTGTKRPGAVANGLEGADAGGGGERTLGWGSGVLSLKATFLILILYNSAPVTVDHVAQASAW